MSRSCSKKCVANYVEDELEKAPDHIAEDIKQYLYQINLRHGSSEYALFTYFEFIMVARHGLESPLKLGNKDIPFPISFFYGDNDWMDIDAGQRVVNKNKNQKESKLYIV